MAERHRLFLAGIRTEGRHGANPGERDQPQPFVVDLEVVVDVGGDELDATANYDDILTCARQVVSEESFVLIETLSTAIGRRVFELDDNISSVVVTVHKPGAAEALGVDDVAARDAYPPVDGDA